MQDSEEQENEKKKPLNLIDVAGVFYILMGGLALSMVACILENIYHARLEESVNSFKVNFFIYIIR